MNTILHERERNDYCVTSIEIVQRENVYFYKGGNGKQS